MPNWCHNTLTITGSREQIARFTTAAQPDETTVRSQWRALRPPTGARRPPFKRFYAEYVAATPLSFQSLVPEPTEAQYAALDAAATQACWLCGGRGKRPASQQEAEAIGVSFIPGVIVPVPFDERPPCNGCQGTGRALPPGHAGSWYEWRCEHWGSKWDASFGGAIAAISFQEHADVATSLEAQGVTLTPETVIYKFDTAWSPPIPFVEHASELYPELEFTLRYGEAGNEVAGQVKALAGAIVEDLELTIEDVLAPEEMWF